MAGLLSRTPKWLITSGRFTMHIQLRWIHNASFSSKWFSHYRACHTLPIMYPGTSPRHTINNGKTKKIGGAIDRTEIVPSKPVVITLVQLLYYQCKSRRATEYYFSVTIVLPMRSRCYTDVLPMCHIKTLKLYKRFNPTISGVNHTTLWCINVCTGVEVLPYNSKCVYIMKCLIFIFIFFCK